MQKSSTVTILTITGADSTGGSGAGADIRAISELGGHAAAAITCVTVQTTLGIQEYHNMPASVVAGQIDAVMNDLTPCVVKVGMVRSIGILDVVVDALLRYRPRHVVYAPVDRSAHGDEIEPPVVQAAIRQKLLPLCTVVLSSDTGAAHGQRNRYASAVAFYLAKGETTEVAQQLARQWVANTMLVEMPEGRAEELFRDFCSLVERYHKEANDVAYYASKLNVSARYLAQVSRRIAGKTPKNIIDEQMIMTLKRLFAGSTLTIQEIAYATGFSSQAHLTKYFKRQTGMVPTKYRKQCNNKKDKN